MSSFIKSVILPKRFFCNETFVPVNVNIFIGRNGSGKSTFAHTLRDHETVDFSESLSSSDCTIHVFDRDFVDDTIGLYTSIPGIITLSSRNSQVYERIITLKDRLLGCDSELSGLQEAIRDIEEASEKEQDRFRNSCWNETKTLRNRFGKALSNKKTKQKFAEAVLNSQPVSYNFNELAKLYDTVFAEETVSFRKYSNIRDVNVLDSLRGIELMSTPFIGSGDSLFSRFIKKIGAFDWVRRGHDEFSHSAGNVCPYCQQAIPNDFEEQLIACFDEEYEKQILQLKQYYERYRSAANEMYIPLQDNVREQNRFPEADHRLLLGNMQLLKQTIKANLDMIQRKIQSPSAVFTLEPTNQIMEQIRYDIETINAAITIKNAMLENRRILQNECKTKVMELIAYDLQKNLSDHRTRNEQIEFRRKTISEQIEKCIEQSQQLSGQIRTLESSVRDTSAAALHINELLAETGFIDFTLKQCRYSDMMYEVVRENGERVEALSNGEKRFLAFLYFYHLIQSDTEKNRARAAVLDDPFAELDDISAQKVLLLIKRIIADGEIQSFVFTCNDNYFGELFKSVPNTDVENRAAFYRIEKTEDRSVIKKVNDLT